MSATIALAVGPVVFVPGRTDEHEITVFDSTGLAFRTSRVARAVYERWRDGEAELADVTKIEL